MKTLKINDLDFSIEEREAYTPEELEKYLQDVSKATIGKLKPETTTTTSTNTTNQTNPSASTTTPETDKALLEKQQKLDELIKKAEEERSKASSLSSQLEALGQTGFNLSDFLQQANEHALTGEHADSKYRKLSQGNWSSKPEEQAKEQEGLGKYIKEKITRNKKG